MALIALTMWFSKCQPWSDNVNRVPQYEAVIQPGNEALVHHMEVFHCEAPHTQVMPEYQGPCVSPQRPEVTKVCKRVLAAWAMGALPFSYPEVHHTNTHFGHVIVCDVHSLLHTQCHCFRRLVCLLEVRITIPTSC